MVLDIETPSNDGEIMVRRDEKGRIQPGSVLNPGGKPKGTKHLSTILAESLSEASGEELTTDQEIIIRKVIDMAKKGDMRAIALVWDRIEGKVMQSIHNINQDVGTNPEAQRMADEAISQFLKKRTDSLEITE